MDELTKLADEYFEIAVSDKQAQQFGTYARLLKEYNQKYNLTAITDPQEIIIKHFLDSLSCLLVIQDLSPCSLIDIGTGAGFPGIPIKIMITEISLTLVESVGKKTDFCSLVINELNLDGCAILQSRAEDVGKFSEHREKYDWAVARAVAELPVLVEYLLPLVRIGGYALAMKGKTIADELNAAQKGILMLGGEIEKIEDVILPKNAGERSLIVISKKNQSPPKYPRRAGQPSKRPLK